MQMAKTEHQLCLFGFTADNEVAKPHQANQVIKFEDPEGKVMIYENPVGTFKMVTRKGTYAFTPHGSIQNLFTAVTHDGVKIHFTKKKLVGKLIYWS